MAIVRDGDIKFSSQGSTSNGEIFLDATGADLIRDPGLQTAVEILLGTEARALETDVLPEKGGSKKGWWGSELLGYPLGSTAWVIGDRTTLTSAKIKAISQREEAALQPLIDEKIVDSVEITGARDLNQFNRMIMTGKIIKKDGGELFFSYFLNWQYELTGSL